MTNMEQFSEIWLVDFEFAAPTGATPTPRCLVAREYFSGRKIRLWGDEIGQLPAPPYAIDQHALFVAHYASAEMLCHLTLGWPLPCYILDLFAEFRNMTNGLTTVCGNGLVGALTYFGLSPIDTVNKESMHQLALRGGAYTEREKQALINCCESDVNALARLLRVMWPNIDVPRALLRGRYMKAVAIIEHNGIPIDVMMLERLQQHWTEVRNALIGEIDQDYGVFHERTFNAAQFAHWLASQSLPWPQLSNGTLDLQDDTFREMARAYPAVAPLRELRVSLSQLRLADLAIGFDGRNRCALSAFRARTGRNQPSNSQFIFGSAVWLRSLIKPKTGYGVALLDWKQQEFGIAAALSNDPWMKEAYLSGDPYLTFAKQAAAVPPDATKKSHKAEREQFKACVLGVQYGMRAESLAQLIGQPVSRAKELLRMHRETYHMFWRWSDAVVDHGMLHGKLWTVFGWTIQTGRQPNPRFLRNYLMQANGSEMLRLASCMATEAGIQVCAPIHDALLIESPLEELDQTVAKTQAIMSEASAIVLNGFRLHSDTKVIRYPERYSDDRGVKMWQTIMNILNRSNPEVEMEENVYGN